MDPKTFSFILRQTGSNKIPPVVLSAIDDPHFIQSLSFSETKSFDDFIILINTINLIVCSGGGLFVFPIYIKQTADIVGNCYKQQTLQMVLKTNLVAETERGLALPFCSTILPFLFCLSVTVIPWVLPVLDRVLYIHDTDY